ncbi:MAG TPA: phosphoribosylformylglycinamidine cyclo-ligase [Spirochaetia bacterium]|nr:phosphoribosylformylglycinamidine cyclo-ligase [Spirochaetia bacterium]
MDTYRSAGVDIDRGDRFVEFIKSIRSKAVDPGIGGFSAALPIDTLGFRSPVLMTTTDGTGTKLLVARALGKFDTIGIDLVAMNVNDLLVCGARPITFLDYIACGKLREDRLHEIMRGIVRGCELAGCTLGGGETAEMPDLYDPEDFDLAGFAVGMAEKDGVLPRMGDIREGDRILGLPSSGIHSNGLSLARKVIPQSDRAGWEELLTPTIIYARQMRALAATGKLLAAAHITGGGLFGNLQRVIPAGLAPRFTFRWDVPPVFDRIQSLGGISTDEMRRVFNLGIGITLIANPQDVAALNEVARRESFPLLDIGELIPASPGRDAGAGAV